MSKEKALEIITKTTAFMATIDGKMPRVRPMMIQVVWDGKLYVSTFKSSRKMTQIAANPHIECVWMDDKMRHVRLAGKVGVCKDAKMKKKYFEQNPVIKNYFSGVDDPEYTLLEIVPENVEWMDIGSEAYQKIDW